jgi:hypothetical protein
MYFHLPKRLTRTLMTFSLLALAVPALAQQTVLRVWLHGEIMESPPRRRRDRCPARRNPAPSPSTPGSR